MMNWLWEIELSTVLLVLVVCIVLHRLLWHRKRLVNPSSKPVLVTGAASGIGKEVAITLYQQGCLVYATDINYDMLRQAFPTSEYPNINLIQMDVTKPKDVANAVSQIKGAKLYGVVNNAGIINNPLCLAEIDSTKVKQVFEVNVFGMMNVTNCVFPMLKESKGVVVNVGSIAGKVAVPYMGPYAMTKHAVEAYSDCLRREVHHTGVRVCCIQPGWANTNLVHNMVSSEHVVDDPVMADAVLKWRSFIKSHPKLEPSQVARAISNALFDLDCKPRYKVVKPPQWVMVNLFHVLPDSAADTLMRLYSKFLIK